MKNKQTYIPYNFELDSIIKPKLNPNTKTKNNMIISPIPINFNKKEHNNSINLKKTDTISSKLFFDFSLNKKNKIFKKNNSINKDKSKEEYSNDFINQNEINNFKKNDNVIKIEIDMINKMLNDNNNNKEKLKKDLDDLNIVKNNNKKMLENYLSKKETLEEMLKNIIIYIKNNNYRNINENYNIDISLEEIKNSNKISFIKKVFNIFNYINNYHDNKYYNFISITVEQAYLDLYLHLTDNKQYNPNNLIKNFFYNLSLRISNQIIYDTSDKDINILLHFILKINIIAEHIDKIINYLEYEYKEQKKNINNKIKELEKKKLSLEIKKKQLIELKNEINEKNEIITQKKSPFYDKTIYTKKLNKKDYLLNNNISNIHFSTEGINSSISNSIDRVKLFNGNSNKKENINKDNNNNNNNERKKSCRNMLKFVNKQNKTKTGDYSAYHSNKISQGKICINGLSGNSSYEKKNKKIKKINIKETNKKVRIMGWTQRKEKNDVNLVNKKKMQNGLSIDLNRNNINKKSYEFTKDQNLTETNNNRYNIKNNKNKNKFYGKSLNNIDKKKLMDKGRFNTSNYTKNKNIDTERIIEFGGGCQNTENIKINDKSNLNNNLMPIYNIGKNKLTKKNSLYENLSFEKDKKKTLKINNGNNYLHKYLTKKNNYKSDNNNNNKDNNNIYYKKIRKESKNTINNYNDKNQNLNKGMTNRQNSFNNFEKLELKKNNNNNNNNNNISLESFCYYKLLEKDSKLFNPLNNNQNLKQLGYNEGFISFDSNSKSIIIMPNNFISDNNYEVSIQLKDITKIYLNKLMKNIIKIHNIFLKYNIYNNQNNVNGISPKKLNINKLINIKEIMNIKDMEQGEKIKAGLCNFFSFVIEFDNNNRIECILINYIQFNTWLNYINDIVNNNIKSQKFIANGNNSEGKTKINGIYKMKSMYAKLKSRQTEKIYRSITEEKSKKL